MENNEEMSKKSENYRSFLRYLASPRLAKELAVEEVEQPISRGPGCGR